MNKIENCRVCPYSKKVPSLGRDIVKCKQTGAFVDTRLSPMVALLSSGVDIPTAERLCVREHPAEEISLQEYARRYIR